jgi:hypothetical protein
VTKVIIAGVVTIFFKIADVPVTGLAAKTVFAIPVARNGIVGVNPRRGLYYQQESV